MKDFFNKMLRYLKEALSEDGVVSSKRCVGWFVAFCCCFVDIFSVCKEGMTDNNQAVTIALISAMGLLLGITSVTSIWKGSNDGDK